MNIRKLKYGLGIVVMTIVAAVAMPSCTDERFDLPDYTVSGADVTISVPIHFPEMDKKTRASFDNPNDLNRVESLWIRTYSADTGEATSDWLKLTPGTTDTEVPHNVTLNTKSGSSYIVGVANVDNMGVTSDDPTTQKTLSELLAGADRWEDFLKIAVVSPYSRSQNGVNGNVFLPDAPLPMAGCYTNIVVGGTHPDVLPSNTEDWQNRDFTPYFIPAQKGTFDLTDGAIHLRRLVSHLTFNIIPGSDAFDLTVNSYQIMNAPKYSWLYERSEKQGASNFGDIATEQTSGDYYYDVPQFGSNYPQAGKVMINGEEKNCISFDYWQSENKHTGTSTAYKDRDKYTDAGDDKLFTSLTGETWSTNNEATYLLISCTLDYKNQMTVGGQGQAPGQPPLNDGSYNVYRTAQATYLVHLGYVGEGAESEKSKDFNCFRNVNYTYNITVNGVNDIRVDAWKEDEYPGEEGMVSDLQYATIDLDAHYNVFNVYLTEEELSDPNFGFIITTYDNGQQITVTDDNPRGGNQNIDIYELNSTNVIDPKYYNWIELRATSDEKTLAAYKPRYYTFGNNEKHTFLLSDLRGVNGEGPWDAVMTDQMKSNTGWYTVFVNEYTYEPMFTGTNGYANETWSGSGDPNWKGYVNQNPRRFYIRVTKSTSEDGNSIYSRSKYGVSQKSIQTYYSTLVFTDADGDIPGRTAIGMECENETEGMNMRNGFHSWNNNGNNGRISESNGRWNVALGLDNNINNNPSITSATETNRPLWSNFIIQTSPLEIPAINNNRLQGGDPIPARTIESGNPVKLPAFVNYTDGAGYTFSDPQASNDYTINSIYACLNRNRDNNGNGRIEPDELRWYVPAMGKYLRLLIGRPSLSPNYLMKYTSVSRLPKYGNNGFNGTYTDGYEDTEDGMVLNDYISRYMYYSSEGKVLWAMEGMSTSTYSEATGWSGNVTYPWQVRCIRNLGSNMTTVTSDEKVSMAYKLEENRVIAMEYYDGASVRSNKYSGNGNDVGQMPIHFVTDEYNKLYRKFQYAPRDITVPTAQKTREDLQNYINGNPCANQGFEGTGWRIPNQTEAAILRNLTTVLTGGSSSWLTCTANYYNSYTGYGGEYVNGENFFLGMIATRGTLLTADRPGHTGNINAYTMYVRCVRDYDD